MIDGRWSMVEMDLLISPSCLLVHRPSFIDDSPGKVMIDGRWSMIEGWTS